MFEDNNDFIDNFNTNNSWLEIDKICTNVIHDLIRGNLYFPSKANNIKGYFGNHFKVCLKGGITKSQYKLQNYLKSNQKLVLTLKVLHQ